MSVSAEERVTKGYKVLTEAYFMNASQKYIGSYTHYPNDGTVQGTVLSYSYTYSSNNHQMFQRQTYSFVDGGTLVYGGRKVDMNLTKVQMRFELQKVSGGSYTVLNSPDKLEHILLFYKDGTMEYVRTGQMYAVTGTYANFSATFTPAKDVTKIEIVMSKNLSAYNTGYAQAQYYFGEASIGDDSYRLSLDQDSEELGFLDSITKWLEDMWFDFTDWFSSVWTAITRVEETISAWFETLQTDLINWFDQTFTTILDFQEDLLALPENIWIWFKDGIISLFWPDPDIVYQFKEDMEEMMVNKFGGIAQAGTIIRDTWNSLEEAVATESIHIPVTTIKLIGQDKFSFGGYDVKVIPDGFEFYADACKAITGISCTFLFVNSLRKRYDDIMGDE